MIMSYHRAIVAASVLAVAAVMILLLGPPARAAGDRPLLIGRSASGPFSENLPSSLFPDRQYVPRDEVTRTFWVKNNSSDPAWTSVSILGDDGTGKLGAGMSMDLVVGDAGTGTSDPRHSACASLPVTYLGPGDVQPIRVTLRVDDLQGQDGMGQVASADLAVSMTELASSDVCTEPGVPGTSGPGPGSGPDCATDLVVTTSGTPTCVPTAVPAGTGAGVFGGGGARDAQQAGSWALGLMGAGAALLLVVAQRRRRPTEAVPSR